MDADDSDDGAIREGDPPYYGKGRSADGSAKPRNGSAWRAPLYEFVACVIALIGVLMFGFGIFPCVNPIQWQFNFGPAYLPESMVSLVVSILVLWIAWRLSREGQRLKQEQKKQDGSQ